MLFDSHSHTVFSADSEMPAEEALRAARAKGLGIVFTEHCDYDYPAAGEETFLFDPEAYWAAYEPLRDAGLSLGVEMGMMESAREKNAAFIARVPFDFVLASIHFLRVKDLYHAEAYEGREKDEMYREYFSVMRAEIYAHPYIDALVKCVCKRKRAVKICADRRRYMRVGTDRNIPPADLSVAAVDGRELLDAARRT